MVKETSVTDTRNTRLWNLDNRKLAPNRNEVLVRITLACEQQTHFRSSLLSLRNASAVRRLALLRRRTTLNLVWWHGRESSQYTNATAYLGLPGCFLSPGLTRVHRRNLWSMIKYGKMRLVRPKKKLRRNVKFINCVHLWLKEPLLRWI